LGFFYTFEKLKIKNQKINKKQEIKNKKHSPYLPNQNKSCKMIIEALFSQYCFWV